jgi:hypothetical protein
MTNKKMHDEDGLILLAMSNVKSKPITKGITINKKNETITFSYGSGYYIHLDRIKTPENLLHWAHHLGMKPWMQKECRISGFIQAVCRYRGWDIHGKGWNS